MYILGNVLKKVLMTPHLICMKSYQRSWHTCTYSNIHTARCSNSPSPELVYFASYKFITLRYVWDSIKCHCLRIIVHRDGLYKGEKNNRPRTEPCRTSNFSFTYSVMEKSPHLQLNTWNTFKYIKGLFQQHSLVYLEEFYDICNEKLH